MNGNEQPQPQYQQYPPQPSAYPSQPAINRDLNQIYLTNAGGIGDKPKNKLPSKKSRIVPFLILIIVMLSTGYVFLVKKGILDNDRLDKLTDQTINTVTNRPQQNTENQGTNLPDKVIDSKEFTKAVINKEYVNCVEVRKVVEGPNEIYVSCEGGVLVLTKDGKSVLDQISSNKGLLSDVTTDLILEDNILYIGTQKGIAIYNLNTKEVKTITSTEGLASDNNISLAYGISSPESPKGTLWVGTFTGINQIDIQTLKVTNFDAVEVGLSAPNVKKVIATQDFVYVIHNSDNDHSGGLLTYDLKLKKWKSYSSVAFTKSTNRIDFYDIAIINNKIFLPTIDGITYESKLLPSLVFTQNRAMLKINPETKRGDLVKFIGENNTKLLIETSSESSFFDTATNKFVVDASLTQEEVNYKVKQQSLYKLKLNRPIRFGGVIFGYNDNVLVQADSALYKYNASSDSLTKLIDLGSDSNEFHIKKILNKPEILIAHQECIGECAITSLYKYNLESGVAESLDILSDTQKNNSVYLVTDLEDKLVLHTLGTKQTFTLIDLTDLKVTVEEYDVNKYRSIVAPMEAECKEAMKDEGYNVNIALKLIDGNLRTCYKDVLTKVGYLESIKDKSDLTTYIYSDADSKSIVSSNGFGMYVYRLE